uniref:Uncharacterized protein n=2 Tax=Alexandrium monilatum TaxID=311494 RepID=A0A6T0T0Y9_9DINO|mmetsp:Transcript_14602/g.43622  ORF Transcript_14602/g.43622 Transcript_14602/m.43622 type:complete len:182 (+) Transcript_14602:57-602(+)
MAVFAHCEPPFTFEPEWALRPVLHIGSWYVTMFSAMLLTLLGYKGGAFVYPGGTLAEEAAVQVFLAMLLHARCALGSRARRAESPSLLAAFVWLALPASYLLGYFLNFQAYVLRLDVVLCGLAYAVLGVETLFSMWFGIAIAESKGQWIVVAIGFVAYMIVLATMVGVHSSLDGPGFFGAS